MQAMMSALVKYMNNAWMRDRCIGGGDVHEGF